ncbi:MAG: family 43 glycosylhydrolase [Kiritimatiellae bacterium]|nr:family 43 glycosylhydrolase [Kiritimatiellia bacterium]
MNSALLRQRLLATACAALLGAGGAEAAPENPVFAGDFPDPTVWQSPDGTWYAASTSQRILKSRDFFHWEDTGKRIFTDEEYVRIRREWRHVWAPDAFRLGGEWLMFVALHNSAADSAIAVYSATNACGPFAGGRILTRSRDTGIRDTIDPEVVRDDRDGTLWMFFGSVGRMHRVKLAPDGRSLAPGAKYEHVAGLDSSSVSGRSQVFEGAYLKRRGGWWYLFASRGWYRDHTYALVVGRARTLDGPFLDREGRRMTDGFATTVLESRKGDRFFGPGHNGEIATIGGRDYMPHHCHVAGDKPSARPLFVSELAWDADGWPTAHF